MKALHTTFAFALALGWAGGATAALAYPGQQLAPFATVSIAQARALATHVAPGKIVSQELEKETGGTGLRYTFDIKTQHGVREVGIDAKTGKILESIAENADHD